MLKNLFTVMLILVLLVTINLIDNIDNNEIKDIIYYKETTTNGTRGEISTEEIEEELSEYYDEKIDVSNLINYRNSYIAIGNNDNIPFIQKITLEDNKLIHGTPYEFTDSNGTIVDVTINDYYINTVYEEDGKLYSQDFIEDSGNFIPFFKKQINYNYNKNLTIKPKYIVIHETANTGIGADADAHYRYWNRGPEAQASTHFVVDNTQIYQMLELNQSAWHVGDNKNHSDITNVNSIGIEVAVNADGNFQVARQNAIDLTINIMKALGMDISQLKRHYDASGKYCPTNMLQEPELWNDFVNQVSNGLASKK